MKIKIHPNSSQEKIKEISKDELEVWIKEKAIDGKANEYLIKFLKKELGRKFSIKSGFTSRIKVLEELF